MLYFTSDYMEGAHPLILERLTETNFLQTNGYGSDSFCESAKEKIRAACEAEDAEIYFLSGGTQTNAILISAFLSPYEGVISSDVGHIAVHEAGAIERNGHKVLTLRHEFGKIRAKDLQAFMENFYADENRDHCVFPGMLYLSHPTEYGTLYSKDELGQLYALCKRYGLRLFVDGARLGYALAAKENDLTIADLYALTDAFYIGGTKCGALLGEALVLKPGSIPHFFTIIKQSGALLAKGRVLGIQFDTLFTDNLYTRICEHAVVQAQRIKHALLQKCYTLYVDSPTNQQFFLLAKSRIPELSAFTTYGFMESTDAEHAVLRLCTGWATKKEDVDALIRLL